jgi:hypothetical protein
VAEPGPPPRRRAAAAPGGAVVTTRRVVLTWPAAPGEVFAADAFTAQQGQPTTFALPDGSVWPAVVAEAIVTDDGQHVTFAIDVDVPDGARWPGVTPFWVDHLSLSLPEAER